MTSPPDGPVNEKAAITVKHAPRVQDRPATELPLVSVVVVNYNYGRYLRDAVGSVFGQTYRHVQCIVVDNASTDESGEILAALAASHPDLVVIRRASNDGQTPASLDGLAASSGHYVIFLDADDYLLPRCVETHVYVHLSMRPHIGFTSGDMLQVAETRVVVSTGEESSRFILKGKGIRPDMIRPYAATEGWPSDATKADLKSKVRYVKPLVIRWVWSPTSGLCYRRDALLLFADNAKLTTLRTGTDLYFAFGCSGLSGSALIDEPLFAYRIHGKNIFTAHAQLDRTLNFTIGGHGDSNIKAQLFLIDHLVTHARRFTPNSFLTANLLVLLYRLDRPDPYAVKPAWARRSRLAQAIARNYTGFASTIGPRKTRLILALLTRSLASPRHLLEALRSDI